MMMVKDVYKYPGMDIVGRQHINQRYVSAYREAFRKLEVRLSLYLRI